MPLTRRLCLRCVTGAPSSYDAESDRSALRFHSHKGDIELDTKGRAISIVPDLPDTSRPRVHRNRTGGGSVQNLGVEQRSVPLKDCTDEVRCYLVAVDRDAWACGGWPTSACTRA